MDHDGAVEDPRPRPQGRPDDKDGEQVAACLDDGRQRRIHRVEQGVLEDEILDRVARQPHLREDRDRHAIVAALPRGREDRLGIGCRVDERDRDGRRRHARETLVIDRIKVHGVCRAPLASASPQSALAESPTRREQGSMPRTRAMRTAYNG